MSPLFGCDGGLSLGSLPTVMTVVNMVAIALAAPSVQVFEPSLLLAVKKAFGLRTDIAAMNEVALVCCMAGTDWTTTDGKAYFLSTYWG